MQRFIAILLVAWWAATPAVCDAFLLSTTCSSEASLEGETSDLARAATGAAQHDAPQPHPCHETTESDQPAPSSPEEGDACCIGIEIGSPNKWADSADALTPVWVALPRFSEFETIHQSVIATHAILLDEIRSPYQRVNRPLLN